MKRDKKRVVGMILAAAAVVAVAVFAFGAVMAAAADSSLADTKAKGVLRIGVDDAFPPMEYRNDKNELVGFDVDLAAEIGRRLGVKIQWVPTAWDGVILALKANKFDMILSSMSITDERKKQVTFSDPYLVEGQIVAVRANDKAIKSAKDLAGKVVGTQLGSTSAEAARKVPGIEDLKLYGTFTQAFEDLGIGRVQAVIVDVLVGQYYIAKRPGVFAVVGEKLTREPVGIAFRKEDVSLYKAVNEALGEIKRDGTMAKISEKWFGTDITK